MYFVDPACVLTCPEAGVFAVFPYHMVATRGQVHTALVPVLFAGNRFGFFTVDENFEFICASL